jgi:hypothetical protein
VSGVWTYEKDAEGLRLRRRMAGVRPPARFIAPHGTRSTGRMAVMSEVSEMGNRKELSSCFLFAARRRA